MDIKPPAAKLLPRPVIIAGLDPSLKANILGEYADPAHHDVVRVVVGGLTVHPEDTHLVGGHWEWTPEAEARFSRLFGPWWINIDWDMHGVEFTPDVCAERTFRPPVYLDWVPLTAITPVP